MNKQDLQLIIDQHFLWLKTSGREGKRADLTRANLSRADLSGADLSWADLSWANLSRANLSRANLSEANLSEANLSWADLSEANLFWADLSRADLSGAYLFRADLSGAKLPPLSILPEGEIIGWKKLSNGTVAKLLIPDNARRINSTGRKCRAEFVIVLEGEGYSSWDRKTYYSPGKIIYPDKYDPDFLVECSHGIHFYITKEEAETH